MENVCHLNQDASIAGPAPKIPQNWKQLLIEFESLFERGNNIRNQEISWKTPQRDVETTET